MPIKCLQINQMKNNRLSRKGISAFISYRRDTGREIARNLYERMSMNGINTFFDYNSMRNGKFNEQIYSAIEQADDFIFVFSDGALDRCVNENDWVRKEIEHALRHKKNIVIVSTSEKIEFPKQLPESIRDLKSYQGMTISQEYYDESIRKLMGMLTRAPGSHRRKTVALWMLGILGAIVAAVVISAMVAHIRSAREETLPLSSAGIGARLYLPRYGDLNREILDSAYFTESETALFSYSDSIIDGIYTVFPKSVFLTSPYGAEIDIMANDTVYYHNLPLRLRLNNPKTNTVIINRAELEITALSPLSDALLSVQMHGQTLGIVNEDISVTPDIDLHYSTLAPGESFMEYKYHESIPGDDFALSVGADDAVVGEIAHNGHSWRFDTSKNQTTKPKSVHHAKMRAATSDYYIGQVEVTSTRPRQIYALPDFSRKLVKGEVDDNVFIIISSRYSFSAIARIRLSSPSGQHFYSDDVRFTYVHPKTFYPFPF